MKIFINTIMKNESKNIERFYNSCKEADGIYVLDTGSIDDSIEKLRSMGNNVFVEQKIYKDFDFSIARNDALQMLPKEDAWVINLDLDEYLEGNWKDALLSIPNNFNCVVYPYVFDDTEPQFMFAVNKIVRNGTFHWVYPIHENVQSNTGEFNTYAIDSFRILQRQDKTKRRNYKETLEKVLTTHPSFELAKFYLLKEYFILGEYGRTIDFSKTVFESNLDNKFKMTAWIILFRCYSQIGSTIEKLEACLKNAYLLCPYRREPYVDMMRFYTKLNMPHLVFWAGTNALAINDRPMDFIEMSEAWSDEPLKLYLNACQLLGYHEIARKVYAILNGLMVLRGNPQSYQGLSELLSNIDGPATMVEIGAYAGESTEFFAQSPKISSIIAIDPWKNGETCEYITFEKMELVESLFDNRVGNNKKVKKVKAKVEDIEIPKVDLAYIDADHTYEDVKNHINLVKGKVRYIAGHDYTSVFPGVIQAVNELSKELNKKVMVFSDTSWLIKL